MTVEVYPHRTHVCYDHPSDIHEVAWMFPTLVPRLSGPLNCDGIDWETVARWFTNHSDSRWKTDDFFVSWLFKKVTDQRIRRSLYANAANIEQLISLYSSNRDGIVTQTCLGHLTDTVLAAIPGSSLSRKKTTDLFWSIVTMKSPPTFHLTVEPAVLDLPHPLVHSIFTETTIQPDRQVKILNNAVKLILSELMGTKQLGDLAPKIGVNEHYHGAFGKVSAYLTALDPDGPDGLRVHIAVWITNAPPSNVLEQNMRKSNFRRDFGRYCDTTLANLDPRAPPTECPDHASAFSRARQLPREDVLWNAQLMKAAGVEVTVRVITKIDEVARLGRMMGRPIRSLVPVEGFPELLSFFKPINGVPDRLWGEHLIDVGVRSRLGELSTPEQIHYLLGHRDFTVSHHTVDINFEAIRRMLYDTFVDLR